MAEPLRKETSPQSNEARAKDGGRAPLRATPADSETPLTGLRGGEFNRAAARQPGAQGIGSRLHTEEVDPYHSASTEHDAASKPQLTKGEESTTD